MKIIELITEIEKVKPHQYEDAQIKEWLSTLDQTILDEVLSKYQGGEDIVFDGYDDAQEDTELLVPDPYSEMYIPYVMSKIDFYNGEYTRYNNSAVLFNQHYAAFCSWYKREHIPIARTHFNNVI